ncbi:hypothetical protein I6N90_15700 [Paenibacillus sp. GSMTC-2017]|nr:hypothetical protein [Paenibacillus sp. GSMTC-2017]
MKKVGLGLIAIIMMLSFATSASAATRESTGTFTHAGGTIWVDYSFYDSHVHGFLSVSVYRVTSSGDVFVGWFSREGGRPGHDMHNGTGYVASSQPAGTYKYVATVPDAWMGPSLSFHN